jgi:DNA-binding response OmpR family regulator
LKALIPPFPNAQGMQMPMIVSRPRERWPALRRTMTISAALTIYNRDVMCRDRVGRGCELAMWRLPFYVLTTIMPARRWKAGGTTGMSNIRKILLVDDDVDLRTLLAEQLSLHEEFAIQQCGTVSEGLAAIKADHIDLVLMDVGLPDMDGREGVKVMRKHGFKSPVIMLTANDTEADTVLGLEAGANDYVAKPFRFAVLLARIRAHLRQYEASEDAQFNVGPYVFRPGAKLLVTEKGGKIRLTEKETSILRYLYRAGQRVVARDVLLQEVWGYNAAVTTHTLETHVYRLRQKVEKDPGQARILVTEAGGYKLVP